ncbi:cilia- and flagella-associated protein 206 isoform X2 [Syngnathoides biaculeatus]|uniref:cilia- and flagella-associated protein 206 isoform X2 n=2 Tax=Syngnathoides biaculeatus TaxID=300417 RepID=UPI002ADE954E|nr:cilia- and flagella-associated protein 206 isoform X2 [Syngnathoides biaculeatus]
MIRDLVHECIVSRGSSLVNVIDLKISMEKVTGTCSPSIDTMKMQMYFATNYTSRREFLKEINWVLESRLNQVSREITDSRVKTKEQLDALYRKIITFILLGSGLGSPSDVSSVQEATAALQSIFPSTDLGAFMMLLKREKEQQLSELIMTVTGIRLFNKASKNEQMINFSELMPVVLSEALSDTNEAIENELSVSQSLVWKYTALIENCNSTWPEDYDVPLVQLTHALYNVRQHEYFLQILLADSRLCAKRVEILQKDIISQVYLLKTSLQPRTAVPTSKVFPLFKALSKLWSELQDEAELLNIFNNIAFRLQFFLTSQAKIFPKVPLEKLLEGIEVKTDKERMDERSCERIDPTQMKQHEWLQPGTIASITELPLQYNGFCGYTLINKDGLILPGNPCIGILKHKEKLYAFNSKEAGLKFAHSPDYFIALVAEKAKSSPELVQLLKLHQTPFHAQEGKTLLVSKSEICTQTDVHPVMTNIVKSYKWNQWELRRSAIKLAKTVATALETLSGTGPRLCIWRLRVDEKPRQGSKDISGAAWQCLGEEDICDFQHSSLLPANPGFLSAKGNCTAPDINEVTHLFQLLCTGASEPFQNAAEIHVDLLPRSLVAGLRAFDQWPMPLDLPLCGWL